MTKLSKEALKFFKTEGRKGGQKTKQLHGEKHFSNAGKLGMAKRWKGHKKEKDGKSISL